MEEEPAQVASMSYKIGRRNATQDARRLAALIGAETVLGAGTTNADTVDGFHASAVATANTLLALDASSKLPADITGDADTLDGFHAADISGAPTNAGYVVMGLHGTLTDERVLTEGDGLDILDGGAGGNVTISVDVTEIIDTAYGLTNSGNDIRVNIGTGLTFSTGALLLAWSGTPGTIVPDASAAGGSSLYAARVDHTHGIVCAVAGSITPDASAAEGGATSFARSDHAHGIVCAAPITPVSVASADAEGVATSFGRSDHSHAATSSSNPGAAASLLASDASGYLQLVRLGVGVAPSYPLHLAGTGEQARLQYDASNYASLQVDSTGALRIATATNAGGGNLNLYPAGDVVFDPVGNDILPLTAYDLNIGALRKKYLTLHVAELWVESLVAQETIATVGGRILVGPTTGLTRDLAPADTTIYVGHNQMASGDVVYLESRMRVEFMQIASSAAAAPELALNRGFETAGGGGADVFGSWTESAGTGAIAIETTVVQSGTRSAKLTSGSSSNTYLYQAMAVTAGMRYRLSFWFADNGTAGGRYKLRDVTNAVDITPMRTLAVTSTTFEWWESEFVAPAGCASVGLYLYCPATNTAIAYFDEVSLAACEFSYTVTRNLDGTGANHWYAGDALLNTGQAGNGFMDLYSMWGMQGRGLSYIYNYDLLPSATYSANYASEKRWTMFANPGNVNDCIYFGAEGAAWANLYFYIGTPAVYTATFAWEYWNGTTLSWTAFTPTATADLFKNAGVNSVEWTATSLTNWVASVVNGSTAFWVRWRMTVKTTWTTNPTQEGRRVATNKNQFGPTIVGNVRNSATFNDWSEAWAIGNLNGLYGYGSDVYGSAFGQYANDRAWVAVDATNGFRVMQRTGGADTKLAQWDTAGNILVGQAAAGQSNVYVTAGKVALRTNTTEHIRLEADGDVFVGTDVSAAATTQFALFTNAQMYGGELLGVGDLLLGNNGALQANVLWDASAGQMLFRGGTTTQAYIDTDGALVAGSGNVWLDSTGINLAWGAVPLQWLDGVTRIAWAYCPDAANFRVFGQGVAWFGSAVGPFGSYLAAEETGAAGSVDIVAHNVTMVEVTSTGATVNGILAATEDVRVDGGLAAGDSGLNAPVGSVILDQGVSAGNLAVDCRFDSVAHGMTAVAPATNTFGGLSYVESSSGGLYVRGWKDSGGTNGLALSMHGFLGENADTGKTSTSVGILDLMAGQISGTGYGDVVANGNILSLRCRRGGATVTVGIWDEDGDYYYDGALTSFDAEDDALAVADLQRGLTGAWQEALAYDRERLAALGVIRVADDGRVMVSNKRLTALLLGAVGQLYRSSRFEVRGSTQDRTDKRN